MTSTSADTLPLSCPSSLLHPALYLPLLLLIGIPQLVLFSLGTLICVTMLNCTLHAHSPNPYRQVIQSLCKKNSTALPSSKAARALCVDLGLTTGNKTNKGAERG